MGMDLSQRKTHQLQHEPWSSTSPASSPGHSPPSYGSVPSTGLPPTTSPAPQSASARTHQRSPQRHGLPKCELILNSSRMGNLTSLHTRNSCKTLKCPKCNWHYKYQETLEIHMKEKHPDNETSCIYCIAGQPHPD